MPPPPYEEFAWLCGEEGARWLADAAAASVAGPLRLADRLRRSLSPERTHVVLEQLELRRRGRRKFSQAERMLFTPRSLEQATDEHVAAYKARRFGEGAHVADICCGIGGDLIALNERCRVVGIDRDPVIGLLASQNVAHAGPANTPSASVVVADAGRLPLRADVESIHVDPDRRSSGRRTVQLESYAPPLGTIEQLRRQATAVAVKLAPASDAPNSWRAEAELEWISHNGECRQQVAWFGSLTCDAGSRRATVLGAGEQVRTLARCGENSHRTSTFSVPAAARVGRFVFDPDAAVLAASMLDVLASEHRLQAVSPGAAYLTGDTPCDDIALAAFEVVEELPFDLRRVRSLLAARRIGRLEIKKRGVSIEPEQLRRQLHPSGDGEATLILARRGGGVTAILGRRVLRPVAAGRPGT